MRNLILLAMLLMAGCKQPVPGSIEGKTYNVWADGEGVFHVSAPAGEKKSLNLKEALHEASKISLEKGFNSFILLNDGANGMKGFPINNYSELKRFSRLFTKGFKTNGHNRDRGNSLFEGVSYDRVRIMFKPVNYDKKSFYSVFNAEKTLKDTE